MPQSINSAEKQIYTLILKLKNENKFINTIEFISILENTKAIYKHKTIINSIIHAVKILYHKDLDLKVKLTDRERQVIVLIGQGLQNLEIAKVLKISRSTAETHRKNIRKKLKLIGNNNLYAFALIFSLQYQYNNNDDNYKITR